MDFLGISILDLYRMLLIMFRIGAMLMTVPVFGHQSIPPMLRIWLMLMLAVMLFPSPAVMQAPIPASVPELVMVILGELAVGFSMGFAVILLFAAVQFAGHLIGLKMGLAVASIIDPMEAGEISIIGEFYYLFALLVFLLIDGHHYVLTTLVQSFQLIPVGGSAFPPELGQYIMQLTADMFILALKFSAPVLITLFIVNTALGIIARTVPQMNVFIVGFPLAIGIGLFMIWLSLPFFNTVLIDAFRTLETQVLMVMRLLTG